MKRTLKAIQRGKEGQQIIIKGLIEQEKIKILSIYALRVPKYVMQVLIDLREEILQSLQWTAHLKYQQINITVKLPYTKCTLA
jgi:hypothetical protein